MTEYDKTAIVPQYITDFIRSFPSADDPILKELEQYAAEHKVPIAEPETARLLSVLCDLKQPSEILEIGCAIGYSAILMSRSLTKNGTLTTIEYDQKAAEKAKENILKAGLSDTITVITADAKDYLPYMDGDERFDLIFLDGPKAHYLYMLDDCVRLLKKGGLLIADNVLYKGMTTHDEHIIKRKITIVHRLREFVAALMRHPQLNSAVIPLGDGITVSVKTVSDKERFGY